MSVGITEKVDTGLLSKCFCVIKFIGREIQMTYKERLILGLVDDDEKIKRQKIIMRKVCEANSRGDLKLQSLQIALGSILDKTPNVDRGDSALRIIEDIIAEIDGLSAEWIDILVYVRNSMKD
jgi:hypothetical protein